MKKQILLVSSTILFITVAFIFFFERDPSMKKKAIEVTSGLQNKILLNRPAHPSLLAERSIASISENEIKTFRNALPDKVEVKSEVAQDPHRPPESLISFAEKLGPLVEKALQNIEDAIMLVDELEFCALNESVSHAARALCLSNTEKLSQVHPQLKEKAENIRAQTSPEVIKLLHTL